MNRERTLETILCWVDVAGEDREACAKVTYTVDPGFVGDRTDPPYPASAEITDVVITSGDPLDDRDWSDDAELQAECLTDAAEWDEAERADAAEARAEYLAEERWS